MRPMPLRIGDTFAGYKILRLLGSGGMGEVYLVRHPRLPRQDALKVLRPDLSSDASFRDRFIREADLAAGLRHPHIVGIHDRGEYNGQLWIAMDYIDGSDAAQLMQQRYPAGLPADLAIPIIAAVAAALDYAHKQGLLHRDVKPANIMLANVDDEEDRRILLTDFGIARTVDNVSGLTTTNVTVGTVAYSAPEQLMGEDIDGRADQYSLAATAYHLLAGAPLFQHSNPAVVITRHLNTAPPALADIRPELATLDPIVAAGLAKRPEDRFSRCLDFARALTEQIGSAGAHTPAAPTTPAPVRKAASAAAALPPNEADGEGVKGWKPRMAATVAVFVLAIIGGLLMAWRPWQQTRQPPTPSAEPPLPSTPAVSISPPVTTTTVPPPPPSFSPKAIDQVLLTDDQLSKIVGVNVTSNPAGAGAGGLAINSSSYGMSDHSGQVTPRSCVGVVFTGEHDVYAAADPAAIKTQMFGTLYGGDLLEQTAAIFSSADQAQQFLKSSQAQWDTCSRSEVDATLGFENGRGYTLGRVQQQGDLITVAMASPGGERAAEACQQALGVQENVVVEARTCTTPSVDAAPGTSDPNWANRDAERTAKALLANVRP
jgi:serine/threonine-protein kinase